MWPLSSRGGGEGKALVATKKNTFLCSFPKEKMLAYQFSYDKKTAMINYKAYTC